MIEKRMRTRQKRRNQKEREQKRSKRQRRPRKVYPKRKKKQVLVAAGASFHESEQLTANYLQLLHHYQFVLGYHYPVFALGHLLHLSGFLGHKPPFFQLSLFSRQSSVVKKNEKLMTSNDWIELVY